MSTRRFKHTRRKRSTIRKDGKRIKYKYPNTWNQTRKVSVRGRDLRVGDQDIRRIQQMGSKHWYEDPVTEERVIDAIKEDPPRPDRDIHEFKSNEKLDVYEHIRGQLMGEVAVTREDLKDHLRDRGVIRPGKIISYYKKRGWLDENEHHVITLPEGSRSALSSKTKKMLAFGGVEAIVFNSRSIKKNDLIYFNREARWGTDWNMTNLGNNIIFYRSAGRGIDADYWKDQYTIFQMHDQAVASDAYKPLVFVKGVSHRSPVIVYSDTDGNGLLIKNVDLEEAKMEVETLKFGRYVGAGVPKDARIIKHQFDTYLIEKLVPRHILWENADQNKRNKAIKDSYGQAGRAVVFFDATNMTDRHGENYMITRRGKSLNITDIDFGFQHFDMSYRRTNRRQKIAFGRKPKDFDVEGSIKYERAKQDTVNRITKLVHTGQYKEKFTTFETLEHISNLRRAGQEHQIARVERRTI